MIKRILFSQQPLWSSIVFQTTLLGLMVALLIVQCYLEYTQSVRSIEHGLWKRGTAITSTLIAAFETDYERGQLTPESTQKLLDATVTDTYEPFSAQVRTMNDVEIASAGSSDLLNPSQSSTKSQYDEEVFVKTDTFRLHRQGGEPDRARPQGLTEGVYQLSIAIDASDERMTESSAWTTFWIHSMWLALLGVYVVAVDYYRLRLRAVTQSEHKTLSRTTEIRPARAE